MSSLLGFVVSFCDITTVLLCVICKVPQIMKIKEANSVEGLNEQSISLELLTYVISLSYNAMKGYPVSSYMEDPFLAIQTLAVLLIVYRYNGKLSRNRISVIVGLAGVFWMLSYGLPHPIVLQGLLTATLPMKVFSKLLQLSEIWKAKSGGSISILSWAINIYTCATRIVTTIVVTEDMIVLLKHVLSVTLNLSVLGSAYYFNAKKSQQEKIK